MLNTISTKFISTAKFGNSFIKPLYENYCFSRIPGTIQQLLGIVSNRVLPADTIKRNKNSKVVFLFLDGFGWELWQKYYKKFLFLNRFKTNGIVSQITSQFPSTTAAHVTTMHTGLDVGKSGVYEWFYYEPQVDRIIAPLLFSFAGDKNRDTLKSVNLNPNKLFPKDTFYQILAKNRIKSFIFQHKDYTPSTYTNVLFKGVTQVFPYKNLDHGLNLLFTTIQNTTGPTYYYYYYSDLDTIGHIEGQQSSTYKKEVYKLFLALEKIFFQNIKKEKNLTILVSADHGMVDVKPNNTFYLNLQIPTINSVIKENKQHQSIVPAGSCRDMFLYIEEKEIKKTKLLLQQKLNGIAEVYTSKELIDLNFFSSASKILKRRLGNLVILPYDNEAVWWYKKNIFEQKFLSHHGGLTEKEMIVPFLDLDL